MGLSQFSKSAIENYEATEFTRYVYGTTSIEGNTYSLRDTDITLNENQTVAGKSIREFHEINNYRNLRSYMELHLPAKINLELIKTIHRFVLTHIDDEATGRFRNILVGIRGSNFMPTPPIAIEDNLNTLVSDYYYELTTLHPVEAVAHFHQRFEEFHPFVDGNGRVGRELLRIQLQALGYSFFYIGAEHRDEYLRALDSGNNGNSSELLYFIIRQIVSEFIKHISNFATALESLINSNLLQQILADNPQIAVLYDSSDALDVTALIDFLREYAAQLY